MTEIGTEELRRHWQLCSRFDTWRLKTACRLITGGLPEYSDKAHPKPGELAVVYEAAVSCAGQSLPLVESNVPVEEYRVTPGAFTYWAAGLDITPPAGMMLEVNAGHDEKQWAEASELTDIRVLFEKETGHRLPQSIAAKLRAYDERQKSKWRSRGLAAYFWSQDPGQTKAGIVNNPALRQFGCAGRTYSNRQMMDWITDLNPSPKAGRPVQR